MRPIVRREILSYSDKISLASSSVKQEIANAQVSIESAKKICLYYLPYTKTGIRKLPAYVYRNTGFAAAILHHPKRPQGIPKLLQTF